MGILIKGGSEIFLNSVNKGLNKRGGRGRKSIFKWKNLL